MREKSDIHLIQIFSCKANDNLSSAVKKNQKKTGPHAEAHDPVK
ncbi:uncharacterized protein METZ01_LOCUS383070 [marine metagenome]|uniref:Uncharacterized protein n=1 Tax=marine metagenome TaxID=408172 RepID=A0A382U7D8_9ZZZZ